MIRNERQYRVTTSERDRLTEQMHDLRGANDAPEWLVTATVSALAAQVLEMSQELEEYAALRAGNVADVAEVSDLSALPRALIRARIAANLTQRDLGERLGLREQQIQRYEANDYAGASMQRIEEIMRALDVSFRGELALPASPGGSSTLRSSLSSLGLNSRTIGRRFFNTADGGSRGAGWMRAAAKAARVFHADIEDALNGKLQPAVSGALFRASSVANPELVNGYALYAQYLAELLLRTCKVPYRPLPNIEEIRERLAPHREDDAFESLVGLCWEHGIPVLPLTDPGAFYGACWWVDDRPVIALKHGLRSVDRWAFLLGHEMDHAQHPESSSVLEDELTAREWRRQPAERAADQYATELLLGDSAEALVRVAVDTADGDVSRLKAVVPAVAHAGEVSVGQLADHIAARIADSSTMNWWPTATNLHNLERDPWRIARGYLFEFTDFSELDVLDREILIDGISL